MSAIFSACGTWRYRLERDVQMNGLVFAFFGVNGATAGAVENDHTVCKWIGFTKINNGRRLMVGNPYAFCATDVRELATAVDPIGPDNDMHLMQIIADADVLVPCWGSRAKLPQRLHKRLDDLLAQLFASGKPVKTFGLTKSGDPKHPLMLAYSTPLLSWCAECRMVGSHHHNCSVALHPA